MARSTAASRASCIRTWGLMHRRWWGDSLPILPLTASSICAVAAQMKAGGYRSFTNYLDTMKSIHIQDYEWSAALALCRRRCLASTQRGIGPSRQSLELPIRAIRDLDVGDAPLVPDGPCCPIQWATLCCFHVLRGAESACALASSIRIDWHGLTESFSLPVSKTDPQAVGCVRTWGCVCAASGPGHKPLCPFHAAASLLAHHQLRFAPAGQGLPLNFPLFPTQLVFTQRLPRHHCRIGPPYQRLHYRCPWEVYGRGAHLADIWLAPPCGAGCPASYHQATGSLGRRDYHALCARRAAQSTHATLRGPGRRRRRGSPRTGLGFVLFNCRACPPNPHTRGNRSRLPGRSSSRPSCRRSSRDATVLQVRTEAEDTPRQPPASPGISWRLYALRSSHYTWRALPVRHPSERELLQGLRL